MRKLLSLAVCSFAIFLTGCGDQAATKAPEKAAEPVTGQTALYRMYQVAHSSWAPDAQVLTLNSIHLTEVSSLAGKSGAWQAEFTSDQLGKARAYTYSVVEAQGTLRKGVFGLQPEDWSGRAGDSTSFPFTAVTCDTDAAYRTAVEKAGDYPGKNPKMTISVLLEKVTKFPNPVWRVIWGESAGTSGLSVLIDATTGDALETLH